jgi:hypothetical protein
VPVGAVQRCSWGGRHVAAENGVAQQFIVARPIALRQAPAQARSVE